jgi:hypothetical protein
MIELAGSLFCVRRQESRSMTVQQIRAALRAVPFRPFHIHMADGRSFHIPHPDFLLLTPTGRTAFACQEDDEFSIVDLLLMTEIEFSKTTAQSSS